jgi:hypothetical protein
MRTPTRPPQANDSLAPGQGGDGPITASRVMDMQRTAGNQATASMLASAEAPASVQREGPAAKPEGHWIGTIKGGLNAETVVGHTLYNPTDKPISYTVQMTNTGYALLSVRSRFRDKNGKDPTGDRDWIQGTAARGEAFKTNLGLQPGWSLSLEFFGERDHRTPDQSHVEGTMITSLD